MSDIKEAIDKAYQADVISLYKALSQAILTADGDEPETAAAEERFQKGLGHAENVRTRALAVAGIS